MENKVLKQVTMYSAALMALTSIHHAYGAFLYKTPWRMHVLFVSVPVMIVTGVLHLFISKGKGGWLLKGLYWLITLVPSIALIGLYEGMYNHALKNILYFGGLSHENLVRLFPPPKYELPNDFWFECTGVLQAVAALLLIVHFVRLSARWFRPERA